MTGTLVAVLGAKGSPGVSTVALGMAARWPLRPAVVVEADPAGGDLTARFGQPIAQPGSEPGLESMSLAGRAGRGPVDPQRWLQPTVLGVDVVAAGVGSEAAASLAEMSGRAEALLRALARGRPAVIIDAGRWAKGSVASPLIEAADVVVMVLRPDDQVRHAATRCAELRAAGARVWAVVVGDRPWTPSEAAAESGAGLLGVVPVDAKGAGVLAGRLQPRGGWASTSWTRLPLLRACHSIALRLDAAAPQPGAQLAEHPPTDVPPQEPSGEPTGVRVASHRREQVRQR